MSAQSLEQFRRYRRQQERRRQQGLVSLVRAGRGVAAVSLAVVVLLVGSVAVAAWLSIGSGAGAATATTVNRATAPTVVSAGSAASISWNPVTLANGVAVSGYRVQRHVGATVTTVCTTTEPSRSCADNAPTGGTQQYGVIATRGSWAGPESDLTSFVGDTTAPTATLVSRTPAPNGADWNRTDVQITIQATDAGSGLRSVNARYGGNDVEIPVSGSTDSAIFTVSREDANAFTFWAVDNVGNAATPSSTQFIRIDKTAPVTSAAVTSQGALVNGWYTKAASVALTATDTSPVTGALASGVRAVEHQVGGTTGTWLTYSGALPIGDGTTTVSFRSTDLADNVEVAKSREVKVDSTPPALGTPGTTAGTPGANGWFVGAAAPVVKVTASDATSGVASLEYRVGADGAWTAYNLGTGVVVPESTSTSGTEIRFRATDVAGNVTTSSTPVVVKYDGTAPSAPTVTVAPGSADGRNGYYRTAPKVSGAGSNDTASSVDHYEYRLNGGPWSTLANTYSVPDGSAQVVGVRAVDVAGNATAAVNTTALAVDTTRPSTSTTVVEGTVGANGYYVSDPKIRFSGADPQSSGLALLEYSTNGGVGWTEVASGVTLPWSTQGTTTFLTRATDTAGNQSTDTLVVKLDSVRPTAGGYSVTPAAPNGSSGWYRSTPGVTLGAGTDVTGGSDYAGTDYQLNAMTSSGWLVFATQLMIGDTGPDGTTLYWRARDGAGNTSDPKSLNLKVDTAKPETGSAVTSGTLGSNGWYQSAVALTLSPSDPSSGVAGTQYQVTSSPVAPTTWTGASSGRTPSVLGQGTSYVWFRSTDVAGNVEDPRSSMVMIDTAKPVIASTYPGTLTYPKNQTWGAGSTSNGPCASGVVCADLTDGASGVTRATYTLVSGSSCYVGSTTYASTNPQCEVPMSRTSGTNTNGTWKSAGAVSPPNGAKQSSTLTLTVTDVAGQVQQTTYTLTSSQ